jgi:hypothetical protein
MRPQGWRGGPAPIINDEKGVSMQSHWARKLILAVALLCGGCVVAPPQQAYVPPPPPYTPPPQAYTPPPQPPAYAPAPAPAPVAQNCREYNSQINVGGVPQPAYGWACQQPDGSWQISQDVPGQPPQVYVVPANPAYPVGYPYWAYDPYWGPRIAIGGSFVFAGGRGFHHHHDFYRDRGFHHHHW